MHHPTAASPSAVLQLSYEASAAASAEDATAEQMSAEQVAHFTQLLEKQGQCGVKPFFLNKFEIESVKNWDRSAALSAADAQCRRGLLDHYNSLICGVSLI